MLFMNFKNANVSNTNLFFWHSVWEDNNDEWDEKGTDWRTIGSHFSHQPAENLIESDKLTDILRGLITDNQIISRITYYLVEYKSGRLDIAYDFLNYPSNSYIIIEADRGEDCTKVLNYLHENKIQEIFQKLKDNLYEFETKRILRSANKNDILELEKREEDEKDSLFLCRELARQNQIEMEIKSCEYQWDKKKITFYYSSVKRIDFRDFLKSLFRLFKIRIWLCADKNNITNIYRNYVN